MLPQASSTENRPEKQMPPSGQWERGEPPYQFALYDEQFIEALAQRLVPRLRSFSPVLTPGQRLAVAITSLVLMIPLIAILVSATVLAVLGFWGTLIGLVLLCGTVLAVNGIFAAGAGTTAPTPTR